MQQNHPTSIPDASVVPNRLRRERETVARAHSGKEGGREEEGREKEGTKRWEGAGGGGERGDILSRHFFEKSFI